MDAWRGRSRCLSPRGPERHRGSTFFDERGQAGEAEGSRDAIIHIGEQINPKLFGSGTQRLKGIPGSNPLTGTCLQTHIPLADPLSGSQFCGIVVQQDFWMGKHARRNGSRFWSVRALHSSNCW